MNLVVLTTQNKAGGKTEDLWRLFVAVGFPSDLKTRCGDILRRLQTGIRFTGAHPSWVKPDSLHLTLAFLGATPPRLVPDIRLAMLSAVETMVPFTIALGGVGLFPTPKNPRVISLELRGDLDVLRDLQARLSARLRSQGFQIEDRPFRPHITLARLKSMRGLAGVRDIVATYREADVGGATIDRIALLRSHLLPDGAEYELVEEAPFGETNDSKARG